MGIPWVMLGGFVGLLALVTYLRVRHSVEIVSWTVQTMDGSTRWVAGLALVPGATLAISGVVGGWEPPHAVGLGLVCAGGWFLTLLGAFGFEGVLLERDSEARARIAERRPPSSTPRGRVVAIVLGVVIAGLSLVPLVAFPQPG